jgi:hypothetical protein
MRVLYAFPKLSQVYKILQVFQGHQMTCTGQLQLHKVIWLYRDSVFLLSSSDPCSKHKEDYDAREVPTASTIFSPVGNGNI